MRNSTRVRDPGFWRENVAIVRQRLAQSRKDLMANRNAWRTPFLLRIVRDDEERLDVAKSFVAMTGGAS